MFEALARELPDSFRRYQSSRPHVRYRAPLRRR